MTSLAEQRALPLARHPVKADVPTEAIIHRKSLLDAVNLMFNMSGLEDKEIYDALDIDSGHFSKLRKGVKGYYFPADKLEAAMSLCESDIPLIWLAYARGKGVHMLETEAERQLRLEREAHAKTAEKLALLTDVLQGRAVA